MKSESIEEEIQVNGSRKIVLGVRVFPEVKKKLSEQAFELGITLSERAENILLNNENLLIEKGACQMANEVLKKQLAESSNKHINLNTIHKTEKENLNKRISELEQYISLLKKQVEVHSDKKLLQHLAVLKGRKDEIRTTDGQTMSITYEDTNDILFALIYSFQPKKP